jgi:hypothetical protein
MSKKTYGLFLFFGLIIGLVVVACIFTASQDKPEALPFQENITIPQADIDYQAIKRIANVDPSDNLIGFVNADGSGNVLIKLQSERPYRPVVSREWDGIFFAGSQGNPYNIEGSAGPIYFLDKTGNYLTCGNIYFPYYFPVYGTKSVLVDESDEIVLLDVSTCKIMKTLVSIPSSDSQELRIDNAVPSDSGNKVIFSEWHSNGTTEWHTIHIVDIDSGNLKEILDGGFDASLSPDEKKIAYVGDSGIYLAYSDGSDPRLLMPIAFNDETVNIYPWPFWSPDGTMLIYHKCINTECYDLSDFNIYTLNVNTGVEKKIVDGGLYPSWIK